MTDRPPLRDRAPLPDHGSDDELHGFNEGAPGWLAATVRFCSRCGTALAYGPIDGEHRHRAACPSCGFIAYINPRLVVTTIPVLDDGRVMLLRRAIEPGYGAWAQPGGFLEADETALQGAIRETLEETGLDFTPRALLGVYQLRARDGRDYCRVCFAGSVPPGAEARPLDPEILGCRWLTRDEIAAGRPRSGLVVRCIDDALAGRRLPLEAASLLLDERTLPEAP